MPRNRHHAWITASYRWVIAALAMFLCAAHAAPKSKTALWEVRSAQTVTITVHADRVVRDALPDTLFGFNINYRRFQEQLAVPSRVDRAMAVKPGIVELLEPFTGALYRYPGGLVANNLDWREAIGAVRTRTLHDPPYGGKPVPVLFGIDEYLEFLEQVDGNRWYVLNLGFAHSAPFRELDVATAARNNRELAEYLLARPGNRDFPRYYQLGNELDRFRYEWPTEKYIERAKATIEAMREVDKDARFVAFFRDFRWRYKADPSRGFSDQWQFMRDVLGALPMIEDYSIHRYYDGRGKDRTFWLERLVRSVKVYKSVRGGAAPRIWITEHARQRGGREDKSDRSNLSAAISVADYLTGLAQIPEVQGTCLHAGGPWSPFGETGDDPGPLYWALRVLRSQPGRTVLATESASPNSSGYVGGYDVRAVAFRDGDALGLWVVNRASTPFDATVHFRPYAGKAVTVTHSVLSGSEGVDPDHTGQKTVKNLSPDPLRTEFSDSGDAVLRIPAASVSSFVLREGHP